MKIEKRGKYAGVKVHLEPEECEILIQLTAAQDLQYPDHDKWAWNNPDKGFIKYASPSMQFTMKLGKKINALIKDEPNLLKSRTDEEIKSELVNEFESAKQKLAAIHEGKDWKEVHIP